VVYAIIPARGGSKGVPGKNIKLLGGYPLIAYSIIASKLSRNIERTIVSTDSKEIAEIAKRYGAEVPFLRPSEFAGDTSPDNEFVLHAINWFEENERKVPEYLVHLRPTTPFRVPAVVDSAVNEIKGWPEATSLRSGHPAAESPFKWFIKSKEGYFQGILSQYSNDYINRPRHLFPDVYIPDGYVDVLKTAFIQKSREIQGDKMIAFISPVCHEVDRAEDFEFLEWELEKKGGPLFDFLKKNFPKEG